MSGGRRRSALVLAGALAASVAMPAHAHLGHVIARAERYVKLDLAGRSARVVVSLTLGAREGARVLAAADADSSGDVSVAERDAYLAQWGAGLEAELPLRVDGEPQALSWGEPYMAPVGAVRPVPVTVEMVARFDLGGGRQTIRLDDRATRREVYDRTDVAFRVRDGATLVASGAGEAPTEPTPDLAYAPDFDGGAPVILTAVVETPARPPEAPWTAIAIAAALALGGLAFALVRRRRRAPPP